MKKKPNDLISDTDLPEFQVNDRGICASDEPVSPSLSRNMTVFRETFSGDGTLILRECTSGDGCMRFCAVYFDGLVNSKTVYESILRPILEADRAGSAPEILSEQVISNGEVSVVRKMTECFESVMNGDTVVFSDGYDRALSVNTKGFPTRSVTEPESESSLSGPREGFTESVMMNVAMLHRKLKTVDFRAEPMKFGNRTGSKAFLCYLGSVAKPELVREMRRRLKKICLDGVLDTNYLAEEICDQRRTLLKTVGTSEKPDVVAGGLLEGRIALLLDGTPVAMYLPYLFVECFQASEDYYTNFYYASVGRILRIFCLLFTVLTPAAFIALVSFHPELLPTDLALSIAQARTGVPFPVAIECFLMIAVFDILREASQRLPNSIAQTLGIVGAIVVGEAAVSARFIGATTLIVVAFSGICGLMLPKLKGAVIYDRMYFLICASFFGFYGILFAALTVLIRLMGLTSLGVPYLSYFFSPRAADQKDVLIRAPWWRMRTRPIRIANDEVRQREE